MCYVPICFPFLFDRQQHTLEREQREGKKGERERGRERGRGKGELRRVGREKGENAVGKEEEGKRRKKKQRKGRESGKAVPRPLNDLAHEANLFSISNATFKR